MSLIKTIYSRIHKHLEKYAIQKKKIYIIPTKSGFIFSATMFTCFLIGLSYANNLTLSVAFVLFTYFIIQMFQTHKNLAFIKENEIELNILNSFANSPQKLILTFKEQKGHKNNNNPEGQFILSLNDSVESKLVNAQNTSEGALFLPRGHYQFTHFKLANTGKAELFYVWRYFSKKVDFYVYPEKIKNDKKETYDQSLNVHASEENEFETHRFYTPDASAKRIDWKLYAKTKTLYIKEYKGNASTNIKLDYHEMLGSKELRLSKLSYLLTDVYRNHLTWSLYLPTQKKIKCTGYDDYIQCLQLLSEVSHD